MSDWQVRRARIKDWQAIARLDRKAWGQHNRWIADGEHTWRLWCEYATVLVARTKRSPRSAPVGVLLAFPGSDGIALLHKIFVAASRQGQGVGTLLMRAYLRRRPARVLLTVAPTNRRAILLYQKLGFRRQKLVRGFYRPSEDRLLLEWRPPAPGGQSP